MVSLSDSPTVFQCFGVVLSAFSLRLLGRKKSLIFANLMHLVAMMMYMSDVDLKYDFMATLIFHVAHRFQAPVIALYIAEVSKPKFRAVFVGMSFAIYLIGYYINELHHRTKSNLLITLALSSVIVCVVASMQATESPYWLALKGEHTKAEEAYEWLRGDGAAASDEGIELFEQVEADIQQRAKGFFTNLFSLRFGIPLLVTAFLYFSDVDLVILHQDTYFKFTRLSGFHDESFSNPFIFGMDLYDTLKYSMPIVGALLFCLVCVFIGRRILFIGSIALNLCLFAWYLFTTVPVNIVPVSAVLTYTGAKQIPGILATEVSTQFFMYGFRGIN